MSTSTSSAGRNWFAPWQLPPMGITLILSAAFIGYIPVAQWPLGVQSATLGGGALASDAAAADGIGEYLALIAIGVITLSAAGLTPWRAGFGVQLATGSHRWSRTVRATAVQVALLTAVGMLSAFVTARTGTVVASVGDTYARFDWGTRLVSSVWASTWEETADVAVPVGIAFVGVWLSRLARKDDVTAIDSGAVPTWCCAAGALGLITRYTDHLYQGPAAAGFVVLGGVGTLVVFARYGTIVPLIVGHFIFDAFVAGRTFLPASTLGGVLLDGGAVVLVIGATLVPRLAGHRQGTITRAGAPWRRGSDGSSGR